MPIIPVLAETKQIAKPVIATIGTRMFVNGRAMSEPYVPDEYRDRSNMTRTVVPMEKYFVMGDHRSSSNDSRSWGMVDRKNIYGKAVFVYWPFDKMGAVR